MTLDKVSRRQFMKAGGIGLLGAFTARANAWSKQDRKFMLYVGTYTTSGKSEGIYGYHMDSTGALTRFTSIMSVNPSFLTIDRSKRFLYAVNEVGEFLQKPGGAVSAFAIDPVTRNLRLLNEQATLGADPCHLSVDNRKRTLLVANYTGGNVTAMPLRSDGTLGMAAEGETTRRLRS